MRRHARVPRLSGTAPALPAAPTGATPRGRVGALAHTAAGWRLEIGRAPTAGSRARRSISGNFQALRKAPLVLLR